MGTLFPGGESNVRFHCGSLGAAEKVEGTQCVSGSSIKDRLINFPRSIRLSVIVFPSKEHGDHGDILTYTNVKLLFEQNSCLERHRHSLYECSGEKKDGD